MGTEMFRIGRDRRKRLRCHLEQQPINGRLVGIGEVGDRRRQREHNVVILDRQEVCLPGFEPSLRRLCLTLRAMPVAAGVVADLLVIAGFTAQDVSSQRRTAALFDGRHDLKLRKAQVTAPGVAPGRAKASEDVGDL